GEVEPGHRLIPGYSDNLLQVGAKRMPHRLEETRIAPIRAVVGISVWTDEVTLQLQVEVSYAQCIDIFSAQLQRPFLGPPSGTFLDIIKEELIQHELRSEEHTSELQSRENLVCRLLL